MYNKIISYNSYRNYIIANRPKHPRGLMSRHPAIFGQTKKKNFYEPGSADGRIIYGERKGKIN